MTAVRSPINQNNALPLISVAQFIAGVVPAPPVIIAVGSGGAVQKVWSPAALNVNPIASNQADPRSAGFVYILTNPVDLTGLRTLWFNLVGNVTAAGGDTTDVPWSVYLVPVVANPVGGAEISIIPNLPGLSNDNMTGNYARSAFPFLCTITLKALRNVGPYPYQRMAAQGAALGDNGLGVNNQSGAGVCRFFLSTSVGQDPCALYLTVYGQST